MSALALKSLRPATGDQLSVWLIGGLGAALSVLSKAWLDGFGNLMQVIAGTFVPVGGVLLAHYFVLRRPVIVADLYDTNGRYARHGGWVIPGMAGWIAGGVAYFFTQSIGGVGPSLATSIGAYLIVSRVVRH
jgi:purine-cytosine permease-like protein